MMEAEQQDITTEFIEMARSGSDVMRRVLDQLERAARTDETILLEGPTGSGKDTCARAIHQLGRRAPFPFVSVGCVPTFEFAESLSSGPQRSLRAGAWFGRLLGAAHGGTLCLYDIDHTMPEVERAVGDLLHRRDTGTLTTATGRRLDVRIVIASEHVLLDEAAAGNFDGDLARRLQSFRIVVPGLGAMPVTLHGTSDDAGGYADSCSS